MTLNHPLKPQDVAFIKPGQTSWDEVIERLGAPTDLIGTQNGMIASYYYFDSRRFDVDFGYPIGFFLPPGASQAPHQIDFTTEGIGADTFDVALDNNGTVQYDGFSRTAAAARFKASPFPDYVPY